MNKNAISVGCVTLVGYFNNDRPPWDSGNCFSLSCDDGSSYKILNFNHENLDYALKNKFIQFPISIKPVSERHALIDDERIPENWYSIRYCETCCPVRLLPEPQRMQIERDKRSGKRIERETDIGTIITVNFGDGLPDWRTEEQKKEDEKKFGKIRGVSKDSPGLFYYPYVPVQIKSATESGDIVSPLRVAFPNNYLKKVKIKNLLGGKDETEDDKED